MDGGGFDKRTNSVFKIKTKTLREYLSDKTTMGSVEGGGGVGSCNGLALKTTFVAIKITLLSNL